MGIKHLQRFVPPHDVDPLATQLVDDVLDSRAAHADAGTDRVDLGVDRGDGDLRAITGFAGQGTDRDDLVGDFRNLELEQPPHKVGVRPAQDDLHPLTDLANVENDRPDALVGVIALARYLLASRQDRVGLAQVDDDRATLEPLDRARDQVGPLILEFVEKTVALGLADLLDDDLLGRLRGDPAQLGRVHLEPVFGRLDRPRIGVDPHVDLRRFRIVLPRRRRECRLNPLEQNILRDILVAVDAIDDANQIDAHSSPPRRAQKHRLPGRGTPAWAEIEQAQATGNPPRETGLGPPTLVRQYEQHLLGTTPAQATRQPKRRERTKPLYGPSPTNRFSSPGPEVAI